MTIPEDIIEAARRHWPSARDEAEAIHMTIARAILAERQRCADVCRKIGETHNDGYYDIPEMCAKAILSGT